MAQHGFFDHASKGGRAYWRRIERYYPSRGFRQWAVGENIVYGSPILSAREALREWLASPPHRAVLFDRTWRDAGIGAAYTSTGLGVFEGLPTTVVTLDVGARRR